MLDLEHDYRPAAYDSETLIWFRRKLDLYTALSAAAANASTELAAPLRQERDSLGEWITGCLDTWQPNGLAN
jgi:hypothetical protein